MFLRGSALRQSYDDHWAGLSPETARGPGPRPPRPTSPHRSSSPPNRSRPGPAPPPLGGYVTAHGSARDSASSSGSGSAEASGGSVQSSAAARATRTSLTAIDRAFARRDFCDNALAAARTSANAGQSDAMCDRIALLSGGTPPRQSWRCMLPCARQQFNDYSADSGQNAERTAAADCCVRRATSSARASFRSWLYRSES